MKYRRLGRTALQVSELCLGTMNFGPRTSARDSHAILDAAIDLGINFIDTANQYGGALGVGTTETIIGEWLARNPAKRARIVLATKVHEPMSDDINDRGLSARHIQMACEASLKRLQVDHIELYQFHHIDRAAPVEELMQAADRLIAQGKITYLGSSNFPGWKIAQLGERAQASGRLGPVTEQSLYNLIERRAELEVIPAAIEYGLSVIAWSPLAGGLLAGPPSGPGRRQDQALSSELQTQIARFTALAADLGASPSSLALAWILHEPGLAAVIAGPASVEQLAGIAGVPDLALSAEVLSALDDIFPPCGAAPEAYAW
jgi:NDP-hexose C3-ketoreductase / dTDP-4-oxo-2-deoxy-alpha-D-pentos-2-ene 2,3-reductase